MYTGMTVCTVGTSSGTLLPRPRVHAQRRGSGVLPFCYRGYAHANIHTHTDVNCFQIWRVLQFVPSSPGGTNSHEGDDIHGLNFNFTWALVYAHSCLRRRRRPIPRRPKRRVKWPSISASTRGPEACSKHLI